MAKLAAKDPSVVRAILEGVEAKRRAESFIRYWEPFEYERRVFEAFGPEIKILIVAGGNRSGKTEVGAALTTAWAEGKEYFRGDPAWSWVKDLPIPDKPAKNIWLVGLDYKVLQNVIWREKLVQGSAHPGFLPKDASVANIRDSDKQIFFENGTVITGMSADSGREKFQSASVDYIWIDEECDVEIFDECYQRTVDCGGKIVVTVTPLIDIASGVKTPWIFNLFEDMKAGRKDIKFVNLSVLDNPIVPQAEKDALCEKWKGHPEERARLFGEFVRRSGLIYPMWDRKLHIKRTNPPQEWKRIVSIDPAATGVTAALFCAIDSSNNLHIYREYYQANLTVGEHVRNIESRRLGDSIDSWLIDPKWGQQRNAETHKTGQQLYRDAGGPGRGLPVRLAEVGEDYGLLASMEYMQATANGASDRHPKVWIDPSCTNFIDEIEHYTWDRFAQGPLKGLSKEKPMKRNDHCMNAYQYLCAQKPRSRMRGGGSTDSELERLRTNSSYF
jgi:phage terminase large subunit-like protein